MKNIVLIGFMGTGKTVVGRILARQLGLGFVDTDEEIERVAGKTITEIFNRHGATRFRSEEALVIKKLSSLKGLVIATGGGAVINPENVRALKENGVLILLRSTPEMVHSRVKSGRSRPLLAKGGDMLQLIKDLMAEREEAYAGAADLEVLSGEESKEEMASVIINKLRERNYI
ncbi:MAG: shikimate kinase [Bacillota bacterium]